MNVLWSNTWVLIKTSRVQTVLTVLILSSLLMISTFLGSVVNVAGETVATLEERLGFYFYLEDSIDQEVGASVLLELTQDLKSIGLEPVYYSKEQAFERLARSLPNVIDDLEKYDIGNPLPATLYVPFGDRDSYELLRSLVIEYDDFITNSDDLNDRVTFGVQEKRIQSVLSLSQTIWYIIMGVLISIAVTTAAVIAYGNRSHLLQFSQQLSLEKLMGASWLQRVIPFFGWTWLVSAGAIGVSAGLLGRVMSVIGKYLGAATEQSFQSILTMADIWPLRKIGSMSLVILGTLVTLGMMVRKHV